MKCLFWIAFLWLGIISVSAQDTTAVRKDTIAAPATSADDLLADLSDGTEDEPLLPRKMIFTQRAFWGPKGLLRTMKIAPLTPENRARELKIRRTMLVSHQVGGFVTLAGFVAQGLLGAKLYNAKGQEYVDTKKWHERTATLINVTYGTTLVLALTSPPPAVGAKKGFTTIKLHKYLAVVHLTGMVATNVLANMIQKDSSLKPYHRAAAYATFGAYAASVVSLTFKQKSMKNSLIWYGFFMAIVLLFAFVKPMAKRKVMADKARSTVSYAAKHPLHNWEGVSQDVNCAMIYNDDTRQPESIAVSIKVSSFDSNNNNRDSHAIEVIEGIKYPNVTFASSDIKTNESGMLVAKGNLTFHGVARPVTLQATRKDDNGKMTLTGEFPVNMSDYKIERPSLMGMKTEDGMMLRFNIVFSL